MRRALAKTAAHLSRREWLRAGGLLGLSLPGLLVADGPLDGAAPPVAQRPARAWTGVIQASEGRVYGAAVSPDGDVLATACGSRLALWDLHTGRLLRKRDWGKDELLRRPAFLSGGKELACLADSSEHQATVILVFDARSLRTRTVFKAPEEIGSNQILSLAATPDGARLAVGTGRAVQVRDVSSGKVLCKSEARRYFHYADHVAFSPDGRHVAGPRSGQEAVRLIEAKGGDEVRRFGLPRKGMWSDLAGLHFSPDGRHLFGALHRHCEVCVWDVATGQLVGSATWVSEKKDFEGATSLAVSADGKTLACAGRDGRLRLFEVATCRLRVSMPMGDTRYVCDRAAFCRPGRLIRLDYPKRGQVEVMDWRRDSGKGGRLSEGDLSRLWGELGSSDAAAAHRAMAELLAAPRQALGLLRRVLPVERPTAKRLTELIAALDADAQGEREEATEELTRLGPLAEDALRKARASRSLEVRRWAAAVLRSFTPLRAPRLRFLRAVELLEALGSAEARKQLAHLAGGLASAEETVDARAALARSKRFRER